MVGAGRSPNPLTLGAFVVAVTLGGANFLAVRFSNRELPPFWGAGLRFGLAALLFVLISLALRLHWPRGRALALTALYGSLGFAFSYALLYWSLLRMTAGAAAVVLAIVPMVTLLLAAAQGLERLRLRGALGALLAFTGIVWMAVGPQHVVVPLSALAAMLAAALCIGQSIILGKRLSANHPAMTNAVGMLAGAVLLIGFSAAAGEAWAWPRRVEALWAVAYLVTLGSVGLFVLVLSGGAPVDSLSDLVHVRTLPGGHDGAGRRARGRAGHRPSRHRRSARHARSVVRRAVARRQTSRRAPASPCPTASRRAPVGDLGARAHR